MNAGMIGGLVGTLIGCLGAAIGTYLSLRNSSRPREHALLIRYSSALWIGLAIMGVWMFAMPTSRNQMAVFLVFPVLASIPWINRRLTLARSEDTAC